MTALIATLYAIRYFLYFKKTKRFCIQTLTTVFGDSRSALLRGILRALDSVVDYDVK